MNTDVPILPSTGDQLAQGDLYTKLSPVVSVNFLNFPVFPPKLKTPLHTIFLPSCRNAPLVEPLSDMMLHFLDLPMFAAAVVANSADPPSTALARWLYYIVKRGAGDAMEDAIMKRILTESADIAAAEKRYQKFIASEQLRSRMDARDKFIRTNAQLLHDAREEGLEEGVRETARGMKNKGIPLETIAEITGLSAEDIAGL
jgi:predicted transposase/invertase (TIGR01784 family)